MKKHVMLNIHHMSAFVERLLVFAGRAVVLLVLIGVLQACSAPERLAAVPQDRLKDAEIPGIPGARLLVDTDVESFARIG